MVFKGFVFLFALHLSASKRPLTEVKHTKISSNPTVDSKCLHTVARNLAECPPIEEPVCIKMKYINDRHLNQTIFMSLINRCELSYVKCYQDVKAEEVSTKYCDHHIIYNTKANKVKPSKRRSKRTIDDDSTHSDETQQTDNEHIKIKLLISGIPDNRTDESETEPNLEEHPTESTEDTNEEAPDEESSDDIASDQGRSHKLLPENESSDEVTPYEEQSTVTSPEKNISDEISHDTAIPDEVTTEKDGSVNIESEGKKSHESEVVEPESNTVDEDHNKTSCPTVCAARNQMVCAKCSHGIYKTFMSVCHVRKFACTYADDKMELISRFPCMLSAPYWSKSARDEVHGKITDRNDFDRVLRYVECRAEGRLKRRHTLKKKSEERIDVFDHKCGIFNGGDEND